MSIVFQHWYIFLGIVLIIILKSPLVKGIIGEFIVNTASSLALDKSVYHLIKNVTLPTEDGTTQIDHVIVSRYGIFVVETKNMKGWIFGGEQQKTWTQSIYKKKTKFQNPLHQNHKHVKTLENALAIPADKIFSVVVFAGDATFKTPMPTNVTSTKGYVDFVKSKKAVVLSDEDVSKAIKIIESGGRFERSIKTHVDHVRHVKTMVNEKKDSTLCPRCGASMVLRQVKKNL